MSLLFVTMRESEEAMFNDVVPVLKYTATNTASIDIKTAVSRMNIVVVAVIIVIQPRSLMSYSMQSIKTLAIACFIAGTQADAYELLQFFSDIIATNGKNINAPNEGDVVAAALNAYGFLYTGLWDGRKRVDMRTRDEFERAMPMHVKQLESSTMEVRVASGENIALMFETLGIGKKFDPAEEWGAEADVEVSGGTGTKKKKLKNSSDLTDSCRVCSLTVAIAHTTIWTV
jgi:hypothetical protein